MANPIVSILVPTYEPNPLHLAEALRCIQAQTHETFHVLVHDDASTADVRGMVEPFLKDPRFTFMRSEQRLGIAGNWNACIKESDGDFVQFLFQDDLWNTRYLQEAMRAMQETESDLVFAAHVYIAEGTGPERTAADAIYAPVFAARNALRSGPWKAGDLLKQWISAGLHPNLIGEPSFVLLRRSLVEKVGPFNPELPQALDTEYWVRALLATENVVFLKESLGTFRVHAAGASAKNQREGRGLSDRLVIIGEVLSKLPPALRKSSKDRLVRETAAMLRKGFRRTKLGQSINGGEATKLVKFLLRHPMLMLRGMLRFLSGKV